jgi:hypothetical protein
MVSGLLQLPRVITIYTKVEMVYRTADSVMISAAKRGFFEAPGRRDTRKIRVTMRMVQTVVVPADKA